MGCIPIACCVPILVGTLFRCWIVICGFAKADTSMRPARSITRAAAAITLIKPSLLFLRLGIGGVIVALGNAPLCESTPFVRDISPEGWYGGINTPERLFSGLSCSSSPSMV
jgi:hypothetical protein